MKKTDMLLLAGLVTSGISGCSDTPGIEQIKADLVGREIENCWSVDSIYKIREANIISKTISNKIAEYQLYFDTTDGSMDAEAIYNKNGGNWSLSSFKGKCYSLNNSRYIDHGDGTVTDIKTGLMWKQCPEGLSGSQCDTGEAKAFRDYEVGLHVSDHNGFAGYTDWMLPNKEELLTISDDFLRSPTINETIFPNTPSGDFLSSSYRKLSNSSFELCVSFASGDITECHTPNHYRYIRFVRGNQ